jgi:hypothetical protein
MAWITPSSPANRRPRVPISALPFRISGLHICASIGAADLAVKLKSGEISAPVAGIGDIAGGIRTDHGEGRTEGHEFPGRKKGEDLVGAEHQTEAGEEDREAAAVRSIGRSARAE